MTSWHWKRNYTWPFPLNLLFSLLFQRYNIFSFLTKVSNRQQLKKYVSRRIATYISTHPVVISDFLERRKLLPLALNPAMGHLNFPLLLEKWFMAFIKDLLKGFPTLAWLPYIHSSQVDLGCGLICAKKENGLEKCWWIPESFYAAFLFYRTETSLF